MLTTEALVAEIPEKKEAPMGGGMEACTKLAASFEPGATSNQRPPRESGAFSCYDNRPEQFQAPATM
jgi:hypothetical protein